MAGYALARLNFPGRRLLFAFVMTILAVPPATLLIPKFVVLNTSGLFDTYAAKILPLLVDAVGIFIMKQFFEPIPREVEEAAKMDGAGVFRTFWSIVLPRARPALITLTILSFQGSWNEFTNLLVATQSSQYETLTTGLARFVSGSPGQGAQYPLKLAAALMATIPSPCCSSASSGTSSRAPTRAPSRNNPTATGPSIRTPPRANRLRTPSAPPTNRSTCAW